MSKVRTHCYELREQHCYYCEFVAANCVSSITIVAHIVRDYKILEFATTIPQGGILCRSQSSRLQNPEGEYSAAHEVRGYGCRSRLQKPQVEIQCRSRSSRLQSEGSRLQNPKGECTATHRVRDYKILKFATTKS